MRTAEECQQIVDLIDELRADELWSVQIHNDNPEFGGTPNIIEVIVNGPGGLRHYRFEGRSLVEALGAAVRWKRRGGGFEAHHHP